MRAQESQTFVLHFRFDSAQIDSTFRNNSENIAQILNLITREGVKIDNVEIKGWSSPDGGLPRNITLSKERAQSTMNFLIENSIEGNGINQDIIHIFPMQENWDGLLQMVEKRYRRLDREQVLKILKAKGIGEETRKWRLQQLDKGYTWDFLRRIYMPSLRIATLVTVHYCDNSDTLASTTAGTSADVAAGTGRGTETGVATGVGTGTTGSGTTESGTGVTAGTDGAAETSTTSIDTGVSLGTGTTESGDGSSTETQQAPQSPSDSTTAASDSTKISDKTDSSSSTNKGQNFTMALKTNMLYDLAMTPNIGVEFHLGKGWSIGANWAYAWWKNDNKAFYWRVYGGELDVRKYFGKQAKERPLSGHHVGIYGQGLTYDFDLGKAGILSQLSYGVGLEYGYSLPVTEALNIDFGIGFGYLGGEYKVYEPMDGCYVWQETRQRHWFGPTRAEVSLVWLIGNKTVRKGGAR
jgi:hypothetical protein